MDVTSFMVVRNALLWCPRLLCLISDAWRQWETTSVTLYKDVHARLEMYPGIAAEFPGNCVKPRWNSYMYGPRGGRSAFPSKCVSCDISYLEIVPGEKGRSVQVLHWLIDVMPRLSLCLCQQQQVARPLMWAMQSVQSLGGGKEMLLAV